ncbi:MAG: hypothetical protein R2880_19180 [Deinococcales bacterium]
MTQLYHMLPQLPVYVLEADIIENEFYLRSAFGMRSTRQQLSNRNSINIKDFYHETIEAQVLAWQARREQLIARYF